MYRRTLKYVGYLLCVVLLAVLLVQNISPKKARGASSLAVTPVGYDDIGTVLKKLGYQADEIQLSDLTDYNKIKGYEAIYINCDGNVDTYAQDAISSIQKYVNEGGVIYASDYANSLVEAAFPDKINFYKSNLYSQGDYDGGSIAEATASRVGNSGEQTATIVDSGLASIVGKTTVSINFDLGSWAVIDSVNEGVRVLMRGPVPTYDYSTTAGENTLDNKPYIVSFAYGSGEVLYTSFHNEAQNTSDMEKILEWFAVRIKGGKLGKNTRDLLEKGSDRVLQEIIDSINADETKSYKFNATGTDNFKMTLNFGGSKILFTIKDPDGKELVSKEVSDPPYTYEVKDPKKGYYTYEVKGVEIPETNYPFVLATSGPESAAVDKIDEGTNVVSSDNSNQDASTFWKKVAKYILIIIIAGFVILVGGIIILIKLLSRSKKSKATQSPE